MRRIPRRSKKIKKILTVGLPVLAALLAQKIRGPVARLLENSEVIPIGEAFFLATYRVSTFGGAARVRGGHGVTPPRST